MKNGEFLMVFGCDEAVFELRRRSRGGPRGLARAAKAAALPLAAGGACRLRPAGLEQEENRSFSMIFRRFLLPKGPILSSFRPFWRSLLKIRPKNRDR